MATQNRHVFQTIHFFSWIGAFSAHMTDKRTKILLSAGSCLHPLRVYTRRLLHTLGWRRQQSTNGGQRFTFIGIMDFARICNLMTFLIVTLASLMATADQNTPSSIAAPLHVNGKESHLNSWGQEYVPNQSKGNAVSRIDKEVEARDGRQSNKQYRPSVAVPADAPPIPISSIEELQRIGNDPEYPIDGHYELTQDIDASDTANWNEGAGFIPIQGGGHFSGYFDGQGHTITGLVINRPDETPVGLFSAIGTQSEITDLSIEG